MVKLGFRSIGKTRGAEGLITRFNPSNQAPGLSIKQRLDKVLKEEFEDNPVFQKAADLISSFISLPEAERFEERTIGIFKPENLKSAAKGFLKGLALVNASSSIERESIRSKITPQEREASLRTALFLPSQLSRLISPIQALGGAILDKKDPAEIAKVTARGFFLPEEIEPITRKALPLTEFEREGSVARLIPRAVVEAIENIALFRAVTGIGVRDVKNLIKTSQTKEGIVRIENFVKVAEKQGIIKFPDTISLDSKVNHIIGLAQKDPRVGTLLTRVLATPTKVFAGVPTPFNAGDIVKTFRGEIGNIVKIEGTKAIISFAGQELTRNLDELVQVKSVLSPRELPPETPSQVLKPFRPLGEIQIPKLKVEGEKIVSEGEVIGTTEPVIEEPFVSSTPAFNEHVEFFRGRQLPEGSRIRSLQKQIRQVNGKRLAGSITPQEANTQIKNLRGEIFKAAQAEGISVRLSEAGKLKLSVRQSGNFVPTEFSNYNNFRDLGVVAGGGTDITRLIQGMDGALSLRKRLELPSQVGPLEKYVLFPTRDISIQKMNYINQKIAQLRNIIDFKNLRFSEKGKRFFSVKPTVQEDTLINDVLRKLNTEDLSIAPDELMKRPEINAITKNPIIVQKAMQLRKFYNELIEEQNAMRDLRSQKPIPYRDSYTPEVLRDATVWEKVFGVGKAPKEVIDRPDLPDYIVPNKPFNPREQARMQGIPYEDQVLSAEQLAESYIATASRDIFNTSIIQNNKAFIQQLRTMGLDKSAKTLENWTGEAYAGVKPALERAISLPTPLSKGFAFFNRLRNMAVFPLNFAWSLAVQHLSLALTVTRYGTTNTLLGFLDWMRPSVRKETSKEYYSFLVKTARQGRISKQDAQNLIGEAPRIYRKPSEILEDASTILLDQMEKILTGASIQAAKRFGATRGLTGEALKNFASDGGGKTQSMYNDEDKPGVLRSLVVKTGVPFQTFNFEIVNTLREWAGKTGLPPSTATERILWILRYVAAVTVLGSIGKKLKNREVWDWSRPPIPFAEYWLSPIVKKLTGEWAGNSQSLPSPVQAVTRIADGLQDVLDVGNFRKLRNELIRWGPGLFNIPGGVQISRVVDAIVAYSQGGVFDRKGKRLFRLRDPQDFIQAAFSGVYTTKEGRELLEKRKKKPKKTEKFFKTRRKFRF